MTARDNAQTAALARELLGGSRHDDLWRWIDPARQPASSTTGGIPPRTLAAIIDRLNAETNAVLADPKIKTRLADLGGAMLGGSPSALGTLITEETEKWGKVVKFAKITPI